MCCLPTELKTAFVVNGKLDVPKRAFVWDRRSGMWSEDGVIELLLNPGARATHPTNGSRHVTLPSRLCRMEHHYEVV